MRAPRPAPAVVAAVAAAVALGCAGGRGAGRSGAHAERRRFEVPVEGGAPVALELTVPAGWTVASAPVLGEGTPLVVRLAPQGGRAQAVLSAYEHPEAGADVPPGEAARAFALLARRKAIGAEAEMGTPLERLEAPGVEGYWFVASGPADAPVSPEAPPGARPYRNMLRGAAAIGPLLVTFTLLDDAPGPEREALLAIVRGARAVEDGARADAAEGAPDAAIRLEPDPTAATTPLSVEPPGLPFLVLVDLPGFAMFGQREVEGTGWLAVGQDAEAGLVASVIVSPAEAKGAAAGARACRDAALARARAVVPDLSELALDETPGAARATYVAGGPRGNGPRQRHAHAFLARDGTCVDVHVSAAEVKPEHLERMERILGSVRFGERL